MASAVRGRVDRIKDGCMLLRLLQSSMSDYV